MKVIHKEKIENLLESWEESTFFTFPRLLLRILRIFIYLIYFLQECQFFWRMHFQHFA